MLFLCIRYAQKHSINNLLGFGTQKQVGPARHEKTKTGNGFLQYSPALQSESVTHPWDRTPMGAMGSTGRSGSTA